MSKGHLALPASVLAHTAEPTPCSTATDPGKQTGNAARGKIYLKKLIKHSESNQIIQQVLQATHKS